jgi:hypothetical protein
MSIFETLGFTDLWIGSLQSDDEMTVVPIVGPSRGNVADPENLSFSRTAGYGTMVFENKDQERPAIVPSNYMVRGKGAQDHAMAGSGVVASRRSASFDNACCVESSQGGLLRADGNDEDILPIDLRKALLDPRVRSKRKYDRLWDKISTWLRGSIPGTPPRTGRAHIRDFYDEPSVKKALEDFAASFEPIENQIGAIIMFAGIPVGIEIMPSPHHWNAYWKHLIRGCYGAEMIRKKALGEIRPSALILPEFPKDAPPDEVEKILDDFSTHIQEEVLPLLKNIQVNAQALGHTSSLKTSLLHTNSGGGGDMISEADQPVYLSLVL